MHLIDWDSWGKLKNGNEQTGYQKVEIDGYVWNRWTFKLTESLIKRRFKAVPTYVTLDILSIDTEYVDDDGVTRVHKPLWLRYLDVYVDDMTTDERNFLNECAEDMIDDLYYTEAHNPEESHYHSTFSR